MPEEAAVPPGPPDKGSISKSEAARQAIAAGLESPLEATEFIRKKFGIEMSKPHFMPSKASSRSERAARSPRAGRGGSRRPPSRLSGTAAHGCADRRRRPARRHGSHETDDRVTGT